MKRRNGRGIVASLEKKRLAIGKEIAQYDLDPVLFVNLPPCLLAIRPNRGEEPNIRRIADRIGQTSFGRPYSVAVAGMVLNSYRLHMRLNEGRTLSDVRAAEAAKFLAGFTGSRFGQGGGRRPDPEEELSSVIAAKTLVFEVGGDPPYSATVAFADFDGATKTFKLDSITALPVFPSLIEGFSKEEFSAHFISFGQKVAAVTDEVMKKVFLWANVKYPDPSKEPPPVVRLIAPLVVELTETILREHCSKVKEKLSSAKSENPYKVPGSFDCVFISRPAIHEANWSNFGGLKGNYRRAWCWLSPEAVEEFRNYHPHWLKEVEDLQKLAIDPTVAGQNTTPDKPDDPSPQGQRSPNEPPDSEHIPPT